MLDKNEVLRYLGHSGQELDPRLDLLIDRAIEECEAHSAPKHTSRAFRLDRSGAVLSIPEGLPLEGRSIRRHLEGANECVLMAVTLGPRIETRIRMAQQMDMTLSLALDAAATVYVERICDTVEREIGVAARREGKRAGSRYSPGYGDLPLAIQPRLLELLDAGRRIGLTCSDSLILLPRKSVTAVVGLFDEGAVLPEREGCGSCPMRETCRFRRSGRGYCNQMMGNE